jgi:hypothetical protein
MKRLAAAIAILFGGFAVWWHTCATTSHPADGAAAGEQVVLDCSCTRVLDDFGNDRAREALLRHLCASANWQVTACLEIAGPEKRIKRVLEAENCVNRPKTVDDLFAQNATIKVTVRFDSSPPSNRKNGRYVLTRAGSKAVDVSLSAAPDDRHTLRSTLMIEGGSLILEIDEYSAGRERTLTKKAMQQVADELSAVKDNVADIERDGYLKRWLPSGSVKESAVELPLQIREGLTRAGNVGRGSDGPLDTFAKDTKCSAMALPETGDTAAGTHAAALREAATATAAGSTLPIHLRNRWTGFRRSPTTPGRRFPAPPRRHRYREPSR